MRTSSGVDFMFVSPRLSRISTCSFDGVENSNACKKLANVKCNIWRPKVIPGHALRPAPNGINSKYFPRGSTFLWVVRNLSGWNSIGSDQILGSF